MIISLIWWQLLLRAAFFWDRMRIVMKAVILAAGAGRRMLPLTSDTPKPLLKIRGKTVLDYVFDALPPEINEVIVTVHYLGGEIKKYLGDFYRGKKISYVEGSDQGNAIGFLAIKPYFVKGERFFILHGDEPQRSEEITKCLQYQYAWVVSDVPEPRPTGRALLGADGRIREIAELSEDPALSRWSAMGTMLVDTDIFEYEPTLHQGGEYRVASLMEQFIKTHPVHAVIGKNRPPLTSLDDLNWEMGRE